MTEEEKLSLEVKQAIRDVIDERVDTAFGDEIVRRVEDKLSPKHPKAGRICEVWNGKVWHGKVWHMYRESAGDGTFHEVAGPRSSWDHYRRIVTAEEALEELERRRTMCPDVEGPSYEDGWTDAVTLIQRLIDNAMEG